MLGHDGMTGNWPPAGVTYSAPHGHRSGAIRVRMRRHATGASGQVLEYTGSRTIVDSVAEPSETGMPTCQLPNGWNFLASAPAYSAFAAILAGFLFLGIITLMTEKARSRATKVEGQEDNHETHIPSREAALMLFLPALLTLLVSSFLFGEVSGEQVCARGFTEGTYAAGLLAVGGTGVFSGIGWMLNVYPADKELRRTANIFTFISFIIVIALLANSGQHIINSVFDNKAPWYAIVPIIIYSLLLLISVSIVRLRFMPTQESGARAARLAAVYFPAFYVLMVVIAYSIMTQYAPKSWPATNLNDWKSFLAVSIGLFFPGVNLIVYARAIPRRSSTRPGLHPDVQQQSTATGSAGIDRMRPR